MQKAKTLIVHRVLVVIFCVTVQNKLTAQWVQVSSNQGFTSGASTPALAFHPSTNELYFGYADGSVNAFIVQKFNGSS
jgi:4-hydroxy-3-methylbut-2-enyl diphosphate reductase IspH